jgi:O-antigen ligase
MRMKKIFIIDDTLNNKISYYLLMAFLVALPFQRFYSEAALACLFIYSLIRVDLRPRPFRLQPTLFLVAAIYLLTMAGTLYSRDLHQPWKDWEKQLAIFLFPMIFSISPLNLRKYKLSLLKAFGFGCLLTVLFLYEEAFRLLRRDGLPLGSLYTLPFMNHQFSMPIGLHATYMAMYAALSVGVFVGLAILSRSPWHRALYGLAISILLASLLQLASRAVCIAVLIMLVTIPVFLMEFRKALNLVFVTLGLACCFLLAMTRVATFRDRYITDLKVDLSVSAESPDLPESRMMRWKCASDLIRASPWIGYGTGDEVSVLQDAYLHRHLYRSFHYELNAHNEYMSFLLRTGVVGLLVFLALLATGARTAIRSGDTIFYSFLVIVFCVSFSENILDTNKGIFFFSFFFSLFFAISPREAAAAGGRGKSRNAGNFAGGTVSGERHLPVVEA